MKGPSTLVRVRAREARSVSENAFRREIELRPVADARSSGSAEYQCDVKTRRERERERERKRVKTTSK